MTNREELLKLKLQQLPRAVAESEVLRLDEKKVLACLFDRLLANKKAHETHVVCVSNSKLRREAALSATAFGTALRELIKLGLIYRKPGKSRVKGEKGIASEYILNLRAMNKLIVRKTGDELLSELLEEEEKSGNADKSSISHTPYSISHTLYYISHITEGIRHTSEDIRHTSSIEKEYNKENTTYTSKDSIEEEVLSLEDKLFQTSEDLATKIEEKEKINKTSTSVTLEYSDDNSWLSLSQSV